MQVNLCSDGGISILALERGSIYLTKPTSNLLPSSTTRNLIASFENQIQLCSGTGGLC